MKQIHYYDIDNDWLYISSEEAYLNVIETEKQGRNVYYCPYNATLVDLPKLKVHETARFNGINWDIIKDYRGCKQVNVDMTVSEVYEVGDIKEGYIIITDEQADIIEKDMDYFIIDGDKLIENPNYQEDKAKRTRRELDSLTLTPSDVERALLSARGWDFDDLKSYLKNEKDYSDLQIKAIGIELRAKDFYRGATLKGTNIRIVDTIGGLLGYSSDDMDYLFEHKQLPERNNNV